jgi:hydroxymethylbilane synthase
MFNTISALALIRNQMVIFKGSILAPDGSKKVEVEKKAPLSNASNIGREAALELLSSGGELIAQKLRDAAQQ